MKNDSYSVYRLARIAVENTLGEEYAHDARGMLCDIALGNLSPDDGLQNIRTKCETIVRLLDPETSEEELQSELSAFDYEVIDC